VFMGGLELREPYPLEPKPFSEKASPQVRLTLLEQRRKRVNTVLRGATLGGGMASLICRANQMPMVAESRLKFLRSVLRSSKILLQNHAILRNATYIRNASDTWRRQRCAKQ